MPLNIFLLLNFTNTGIFNSANDLSIIAINSNSLIKELEHDISTGDKTTTEIQAKMKEVEDFKKIINQ